MLSDTHDTQDDNDGNPTQGPMRDEDSGDPAPSLNAASSEEQHSPPQADEAPSARGNYLIPGISYRAFFYLSVTKSDDTVNSIVYHPQTLLLGFT